MSSIIPHCFHPDGTPCIAYGIDAQGGSYSYHAPPATETHISVPSHPQVHWQHGVPEPTTMGLMALGLAALSLRRRPRASAGSAG
jgi:hypothetical protein